MPIKRMLKGRNFSPQSAAILVKAFNDVVDELDLRTLVDRNRAANGERLVPLHGDYDFLSEGLG